MSVASLKLLRPRVLPFYNGFHLSRPIVLHVSRMGFVRVSTVSSPKGDLCLVRGFLECLSQVIQHILLRGCCGGAILALSIIRLKVWRGGKSSLTFILGQEAIAAMLVWKNLQVYALKKELFPSEIYLFISAAMFCFYAYVLISGGNPPPKKLAAVPPS